MVTRPSAARPPQASSPRIVLRVDLPSGARVGPGKVALLEAIASSGSISGAGRALRMSYRRAWELVEDMNRYCPAPLVAAMTGGSGGGGARLTEQGASLVAAYRALERTAMNVCRAEVSELAELCGRVPDDCGQ